MKKSKLIILIGSLVLITSCVLVFAAFMFHKNVTGTASTGKIEADEMYFGDYSGVTEENTLANYMDAKGGSITCYATEKQGWANETDNIYLNQLSLKFSYETNMAVYVRVHIQDAWISTKIYTSGNITTTYIEKDKIDSGQSPFYIDDEEWHYDEATNCMYYKTMVTVTEGESSETKEHEFKLDSNYFYRTESSTSYREHVTVQVSYYVDIVQANRAERIWGVDLDSILNTENNG
ncbi:MAG: hypothetical protein IJA65_05720 [Acholeplasmatales bacterium]|nr:hypothetical protein [Acholeplasmatales bacterium]